METFIASLGEEIQDADEETFDVFSQSTPSQDLGMVDPKAAILELSIAGRDFEVAQSPGVLQSARSAGTTGAAVWQASVRFAEWLQWPKNPLFVHGVLGSHATVLELGSGVSGVVPSILAHKVRRVVATDQKYILKILQENITANARRSTSQRKTSGKNGHTRENVEVLALDWENDDVPNLLSSNSLGSGVDLVTACDCVYNYALISPFVQTCVDICEMRQKGDKKEIPTLCIVAQQLRQADVFQQWMEAFHERFRVWRMPSELLSESLREGSGFIVHVGVLRSSMTL